MRITIFILLIIITSCARTPKKPPVTPLKLSDEPIKPTEEVLNENFSPFVKRIEEVISILKKRGSTPFIEYPEFNISSKDYAEALAGLLKCSAKDPHRFHKSLSGYFEPYDVYGRDRWGEVLLTAYFQPEIKGRIKPHGKFTQPLYRMPKDLVSIQLDEFPVELNEDKPWSRSRIFARIEKKSWPPKILPYHDRLSIDKDKVLKNRNLELAYVDPIDAFFFHIQGSGTVVFPGGQELNLGYAGQNGHPYVPLGKELEHIIPMEEMSLQSIETHLRTLDEDQLQNVLGLNPSYIFFKKLSRRPLTTFGLEVVNKRTIAVDNTMFPLGALSIVETSVPDDGIHSDHWKKEARVVLALDTGGAIKGADRIDIFWGKGKEALEEAGRLRHLGRAQIYLPRSSGEQRCL